MTGRLRRWRAVAVAALIALVAAWWLSGLVVVERLTRRAAPPRPEPAPPGAEAHRLAAADGEELGAWLFPGPPDAPAVVLLHGNGGSRSAELRRARALGARGLTVLAVTLRAHGDSTGARNDFGWSARRDVAAAVRFLEERRPGRPIVLFGSSLGAAAALFAAGEVGDAVDGYVLESPYRDLGRASRNRIGWFLGPPLDALAWWALRAAAPVLIESEAIRPVDHAALVPRDVPALVLAGETDRHAGPDEAAAVHARLGPRARLVVVSGAAHGRLEAAAPDLYWGAVDALLAAVREDRAPAAHSSGR